MNKKHVIIKSIRAELDYLTKIARYWIAEDEWDMANVYIEKCLNVQERHDNAVKHYQQANLKQTLIIN